MVTIRLPREARQAIEEACQRAGERETGGMLFGENTAEGEFRVLEATVAGMGTVASFLRVLRGSLQRLNAFFRRTEYDYQRYNYLGEWHSHPSFALRPSGTDDATMRQIVDDPGTNARFAVSLIVKLVRGDLVAAGFAYFPGGAREDVSVIREDSAPSSMGGDE